MCRVKQFIFYFTSRFSFFYIVIVKDGFFSSKEAAGVLDLICDFSFQMLCDEMSGIQTSQRGLLLVITQTFHTQGGNNAAKVFKSLRPKFHAKIITPMMRT